MFVEFTKSITRLQHLYSELCASATLRLKKNSPDNYYTRILFVEVISLDDYYFYKDLLVKYHLSPARIAVPFGMV
jgi:hypothetical protein